MCVCVCVCVCACVRRCLRGGEGKTLRKKGIMKEGVYVYLWHCGSSPLSYWQCPSLHQLHVHTCSIGPKRTFAYCFSDSDVYPLEMPTFKFGRPHSHLDVAK